MNHLRQVRHLADAPSSTPPADERPACVALRIEVPRRDSTADDWTGVTAIAAQAETVDGAGLTAGAVVALEAT